MQREASDQTVETVMRRVAEMHTVNRNNRVTRKSSPTVSRISVPSVGGGEQSREVTITRQAKRSHLAWGGDKKSQPTSLPSSPADTLFRFCT